MHTFTEKTSPHTTIK